MLVNFYNDGSKKTMGLDEEAREIFDTLSKEQKKFVSEVAQAVEDETERVTVKRYVQEYARFQHEYKIKHVIFSGPATIVFWDDGDKTVVKCMDGDQLNYEMGIAMCTLKKIFGASYLNFKKDIKKWAPEVEKKERGKEFSDAFAEFLRDWDKKNEKHTGTTPTTD